MVELVDPCQDLNLQLASLCHSSYMDLEMGKMYFCKAFDKMLVELLISRLVKCGLDRIFNDYIAVSEIVFLNGY